MGHLPFACLCFYTLQNLGLDLCHNPERLHLSGCRVWMLHLGGGGQGLRNECLLQSYTAALGWAAQPGLDKLTQGQSEAENAKLS